MGLSRSIIRNKAKTEYKKFVDAWNKEKAYQAWMKTTGQELPSGTPLLRLRPTFAQWSKLVKTSQARQTATPEDVQDFKDDVDLNWEEEGVDILK